MVTKDVEENDTGFYEVRNPRSTNKLYDGAFQLEHWDPEDDKFWANEGKTIAYRNLICSIPNLFLGFAIWLMWSIIVVVVQDTYFDTKKVCEAATQGVISPTCPTYHFNKWIGDNPSDSDYKAALYTVQAVAGLSGGIMRLVNTFMIPMSGGRVTIALSTIALMIPCIWASEILKSKDASFVQLVICAALTGVGGGAFSSSMPNIRFFFPKRKIGLALGLNAGIGNLGVSMSQLVLPAIMAYNAFGSSDVHGSGTYGQNPGIYYAILCCIAVTMASFGMSNMPKEIHQLDSVWTCIGNWIAIHMLGVLSTAISTVILIYTSTQFTNAFKSPGTSIIRIFILVMVSVVVSHACLYFLVPSKVKTKILEQAVIFKNKHNFIMTYLYIMTFGSFIGFSGAFPKLMRDLFPDARVKSYSWTCAFVGSIIRPVGGWMSDRWGGSAVTHWHTVLQTATSFAVGIVCWKAKDKMNDGGDDSLFPWFVLLFNVLFYCTGVGNGSTFQMIGVIFDKFEGAAVLGWSSAIASFGAFIIPAFFGVAIKQEMAEIVMYAMGAYYFSCLYMNYWYYYRKDAEKPC